MARPPRFPQGGPDLSKVEAPDAVPASVVDTDGGSREDPGPAAEDALARDPTTGDALSCDAAVNKSPDAGPAEQN